jgi:hypothetical protein
MRAVKGTEITPVSSEPHNNIGLNSDIKKLLDVVSSIIANEYIEIAKENPDVFKDKVTK